MRWRECEMQIATELCSAAFWRDALVEFTATFLLIFSQISLCLGWESETGARLGMPLGSGFIVAGIGWALCDFGGAHMNPAVTLTLLVRFRISVFRAFVYWILQFAAAIAAAFIVKGILPSSLSESTTLGTTTVNPMMEPWKGLMFELVITFALCCTVHGSLNVKRKGILFMPPLATGLVLAAGIFIAWPWTGGSLNPARTLGPSLAIGNWEHHWVYWGGPMGGAFLAGVLYSLINKPRVTLPISAGKINKGQTVKPIYKNISPRRVVKIEDVTDRLPAARRVLIPSAPSPLAACENICLS